MGWQPGTLDAVLPAAERASCLLRLALTHSQQGAHTTALRDLARALAAGDLAVTRRAGITIALRARRRDLVLEHAAALLDQAPRDE